jgi:Na+/H+ antiporter NhaC
VVKRIDFRAAVYGTISVGALLAAESAHEETYLATVSAVVLTLLLYVFAHTYAEYTGERLREGEPLRFEQFRRTAVKEAWLLPGAAVPLLALLICWLIGASLSTAVNAAVWTSAGMVLVLEITAGVRAGETGRDLAVETAVGALLGLLVIALRYVLH